MGVYWHPVQPDGLSAGERECLAWAPWGLKTENATSSTVKTFPALLRPCGLQCVMSHTVEWMLTLMQIVFSCMSLWYPRYLSLLYHSVCYCMRETVEINTLIYLWLPFTICGVCLNIFQSNILNLDDFQKPWYILFGLSCLVLFVCLFLMDNPHPSVYLLAVQSLQIQSSNQRIDCFPCEYKVCLLSFAVAFLGFQDPVSSLTWISDLATLLEFEAWKHNFK